MSAMVPITASSNRDGSAIRTLIVDDSVVVRTVIERILQGHPGFVVAQKSKMAENALRFLERDHADLILLDIELPGQSGLAALPAILRASGGAKVVILSGSCEEGSAAAVEALALGASDILAKPDSGAFGNQFPQMLLDRLGRLFGEQAAGAISAAPPPLRMAPQRNAAPLGCLGIGASTGGIHALGQLFAGLAAPLGVPILVTQHLPVSFTRYFAEQLARMTTLPVKVARHGALLAPDTVYVAPGDANLECRRGRDGRVNIILNPERTASGNLPGVDPMFAAMAEAYGPGAAGIILTGMGRDGLLGARAIVAAGGWIVAQDQGSSVVWGMPGSAAEAGLTSALLAPEMIMPFVAQRARAIS
ncbi:chemotaxis protein CheB [Sphingobium sp. AN641]|uniref:chemotaxis protein CheB n=1 Tax=Sphingobium sp. AN641 TaxID=3133443 RepID=UPI0030BCB4EC